MILKDFWHKCHKEQILDEIQRVPELTSYIQVIVDQDEFRGLFVLTGSQNFSIRNTLSQSLAGRILILTLLPFTFDEISHYVDIKNLEQILFQGFYPRISHRSLGPTKAYADYVSTYLERDLRQLELVKNIDLFQKFLRLLAGRVGQILNLESLANDVGVTQPTIREWITLLEASYIIYRLPPFFENIGKRLIKSPKIYFYDVGLVSYLIGIENPSQLKTHPLRGVLFENMIISEVLKTRYNQAKENNLMFYRDSNGVEVDLLIPKANTYDIFEIKSSQTIASNFFKGLISFEKSTNKKSKAHIIFAGEFSRLQNEIQISPYFTNFLASSTK